MSVSFFPCHEPPSENRSGYRNLEHAEEKSALEADDVIGGTGQRTVSDQMGGGRTSCHRHFRQQGSERRISLDDDGTASGLLDCIQDILGCLLKSHASFRNGSVSIVPDLLSRPRCGYDSRNLGTPQAVRLTVTSSRTHDNNLFCESPASPDGLVEILRAAAIVLNGPERSKVQR